MLKTIATLSIFLISSVAFGSNCSGPASASKTADLVDTAQAAGQFDTLVTAIQAAGLVDVLKGDGPFTVFAPTDEAFAKLPSGALQELLQDKEKLAAVLTYHVVPGRITADEVVKLASAKTVQGQSLSVSTASGVSVNQANVIQTDIEATNGVIHIIDSVVLPTL